MQKLCKFEALYRPEIQCKSHKVGLCRAENFPARAGPGQKNSPKNRPGPGRAKPCFSKNRPGPKRAEKNMARAKKGQKFLFNTCQKVPKKVTNLTDIY